jgi:hypothetical protein
VIIGQPTRHCLREAALGATFATLVSVSYLFIQGISKCGELSGGGFHDGTSGKGPKRDANSVGQHGEVVVSSYAE